MSCANKTCPKIRSKSACSYPAKACESRCSVVQQAQSSPDLSAVFSSSSGSCPVDSTPAPEPCCGRHAICAAGVEHPHEPHSPIAVPATHDGSGLERAVRGRRRGKAAAAGPQTWREFAQVLRDKGMMRAAAAIVRQRCRHCDLQTRCDRRAAAANRTFMIEGTRYDGPALNAFTQRQWCAQRVQFGRWPTVYERLPELRGALPVAAIMEANKRQRKC